MPKLDRWPDRPAYPPLEPWEEAFAELDRALPEHPSIRKLDPRERPTIWFDADHVMLRGHGAEYEIRERHWWSRCANEAQARVMVDQLVLGLREAIRRSRKVNTSSAGA